MDISGVVVMVMAAAPQVSPLTTASFAHLALNHSQYIGFVTPLS
jgi:hypothetical protein